jgi:hypothetical protein
VPAQKNKRTWSSKEEWSFATCRDIPKKKNHEQQRNHEVPIGLRLLNSQDEQWQCNNNEQRCKHAKDKSNVRRLGRRHPMGHIPSNEMKLSHRWRERAWLAMEMFS